MTAALIPGLFVCSIISSALGVGCAALLWPDPKEKPDVAEKYKREAIAIGMLLGAFWPVLLVAAWL